jgi:ABC-type polysaccharide/polyol phosphate transport system ATPase subunit
VNIRRVADLPGGDPEPWAAITVQNLGKRFVLHHERPRSLSQELLALFRVGTTITPFWAFRDVTFSVPRGQAVGVIGRNGSGKSTLLKILAGTMQPTTGTLIVRGSISTLLQLGAGFHPEFSGRTNVFLSAALLGIPTTTIRREFDAIVAFAELEQFIDVPIKYYSAGMLARLGFALSTAVPADILLIDEVLAVGDVAFQRKCDARMRAMLMSGSTLVIVSHDAEAVRLLCEQAVWIDRGVMRASGTAEAVVDAYLAASTG